MYETMGKLGHLRTNVQPWINKPLGCLIGRVPWFINPGLTLDGGL